MAEELIRGRSSEIASLAQNIIGIVDTLRDDLGEKARWEVPPSPTARLKPGPDAELARNLLPPLDDLRKNAMRIATVAREQIEDLREDEEHDGES